jgi:molecular chaperone GrpE
MKDENLNTLAAFVNEQPDFVAETESFDTIEDEAERLLEELRTERDHYMRLAAEYDNYRRRVRQERSEAGERGKRELLLQLVTFADDFERALANLDEKAESVVDGLRVISLRFTDVLRTNGVVSFESKGETFDPERHEAFDVVVTRESDSGTVQTEFRRGYFWNDKLLRPALVIVGK